MTGPIKGATHLKLSLSVTAYMRKNFDSWSPMMLRLSGELALQIFITHINDIYTYSMEYGPGIQGSIFIMPDNIHSVETHTDKPCHVANIARQQSDISGSALLVVNLAWVDRFGPHWGCPEASLEDGSSIKELYLLRNFAFWYMSYGFSYNVEQVEREFDYEKAFTALSSKTNAYDTLQRNLMLSSD
ncbi:unnamed protein product [Vitrella brassicaformis CCMP3155]|uniref:Uncharacterized protein n=1 Tax=Vitrella brassicaformis (strain CCMP3155) TaxID=1169540 RepID=A0A0G4G451_VITBC|nr:unnamed protein product [Vitrella brassicaformis CCMP3155]|eukprot:CEM23071.1 unnamed protein product [Vitrella brassicaformis CCMP3155]